MKNRKHSEAPTQEDLPKGAQERWEAKGWMPGGGQARPISVRRKSDGFLGVLKEPFRPEETEAIERFRREVEVLGGIEHPGVVRIEERGEDDGIPWFITKRGASLADRWPEFQKGRPSPDTLFRRSRDVILALLDALEECHEQGVLHRDVKVANVVLMEPGIACPQLIDFGIAFQAEQARLTSPDEPVGNLRSKPPAAFYQRVEEPGPWWDVRSLVLLWVWMLSPGRLRGGNVVWHYTYHRFAEGLGIYADELRALWAVVDAGIGPITMAELREYIEGHFGESRRSNGAEEGEIEQALIAQRRGEAVRNMEEAEKASAKEAGVLSMSPALRRLVDAIDAVAVELREKGLPVSAWYDPGRFPAEPGTPNLSSLLPRLTGRTLLRQIECGEGAVRKGCVRLFVGFAAKSPETTEPVFYLTLSLHALSQGDEKLVLFLARNGKWGLRGSGGAGMVSTTYLDDADVLKTIRKWLSSTAMWENPRTLAP